MNPVLSKMIYNMSLDDKTLKILDLCPIMWEACSMGIWLQGIYFRNTFANNP